MVKKIIYDEMPICTKEILRYTGAKGVDKNIENMLNSAVDEARTVLKYTLCYDEFSVNIVDNICDFSVFKIKSKSLSKNLSGCNRAIVFGATVGSGIDRLIAKYGVLSPSKALVLQSFGAERIEALCDKFCSDLAIKLNRTLKPRFSPGYGDVPLDTQSDIFRVLDLPKHIGLCLNDSLLMSPSKSVTAIVGITEDDYIDIQKVNKCKNCTKGDCEFRSRNDF